MSQIPIRINKGSGAVLPGVWAAGDDPEAPGADLTGWTIDIYDPVPELASLLSVAWTDAATGEFAVTCQPITASPQRGALWTFRLRITPASGQPKTSPAIAVDVR